jgi:hypothetical protein
MKLIVADIAHLIKSAPLEGEFEIEVRDENGNVVPAHVIQHGGTETGIKIVVQGR